MSWNQLRSIALSGCALQDPALEPTVELSQEIQDQLQLIMSTDATHQEGAVLVFQVVV